MKIIYVIIVFISIVLIACSDKPQRGTLIITTHTYLPIYRDELGFVYRVSDEEIRVANDKSALEDGDFIEIEAPKNSRVLSIHEKYNNRIFIKLLENSKDTFVWEIEPELERMMQVDLSPNDFSESNELQLINGVMLN